MPRKRKLVEPVVHVRYLLDLAYNAIRSVAIKRLDDPL
jgi:hypothetical protein